MENALTTISATEQTQATAAPNRDLNQREKAAVIVRFLLNEGTELSLSGLSSNHQSALTEQMGGMRYIDRDTLNEVLAEFLQELEGIGLSFPGGVEGALSVLGDRLSPETAGELLARVRGEAGHDPWRIIAALPAEKLVPVLEEETPEVGAVVLSKLEVAKAAELLGRLPGARARRLSHAVSRTDGVAPETVARIGQALSTRFASEAPRAFNEDSVARVGAILDVSPAATREEVITGLEDEDAAFAARVRAAMFTFEDIPDRLAQQDVPGVMRAVEQDVLVTALAFAGAAAEAPETPPADAAARAAEYLLASISPRLAAQLRDEVAERGKVAAKDGERATLADLVLQSPGEAGEEGGAA